MQLVALVQRAWWHFEPFSVLPYATHPIRDQKERCPFRCEGTAIRNRLKPVDRTGKLCATQTLTCQNSLSTDLGPFESAAEIEMRSSKRSCMDELRSEFKISASRLRRAKQRLQSAEQDVKKHEVQLTADALERVEGDLADADYQLQQKRKELKGLRVWYLVIRELASPSHLALHSVSLALADVLLFLVIFLLFGSFPAALLLSFIVGVLACATIIIGKAYVDASQENASLAYDNWQRCDWIIRELEHRVIVLESQSEYRSANENWAKLCRIAKSERHKLLHTDWRSLRGIPFEDYLADVFELLGYTIEKTKASGDQGIDLIATGKSRRIAIQCKGYKDSVGNRAVQEAYAGKQFYDCGSCMVITNSVFTRQAIELASKLNCRLIDENDINRLILGKIL